MHNLSKTRHAARDWATLAFTAGPRQAGIAALALALATAPRVGLAGGDAERRAGDVLSYALPLGTLGVELWRDDRRGALQLAATFVVTTAATEVLKRSTHVERPDRSNDESFPSGHASRAFAAAAYVHRRYGMAEAWPLYALATYVGYTRVQARRHHWTDIAGSAGLAVASSWCLVTPRSSGLQVSARGGRGFAIGWSVALP